MNRRQWIIGTSLCALLPSSLVWAQSADVNPYEWVVALGNEVLNQIKKNPQLRDGQIDQIRELVNNVIRPNVDFRMVTRMTVGPSWRRATPQERERLETLFEQLLIRVYSGALKQITDHVCVLKKQRNYPISNDLVVNVMLESASHSGKPIAMAYRVYKNKDGEWKIVDMNVEGIWMVENYHAQFASVIDQNGIAGLITLLEQKVAEAQ